MLRTAMRFLLNSSIMEECVGSVKLVTLEGNMKPTVRETHGAPFAPTHRQTSSGGGGERRLGPSVGEQRVGGFALEGNGRGSSELPRGQHDSQPERPTPKMSPGERQQLVKGVPRHNL